MTTLTECGACNGEGCSYCRNMQQEADDKIAELNDTVAAQAVRILDLCNQLEVTEKELDDYRKDAKEHFGPYGIACMATGQFDAGECWLCYMKRQKKLLTWMKDNLLTDSQLDVTPPGYKMTLRGRPS